MMIDFRLRIIQDEKVSEFHFSQQSAGTAAAAWHAALRRTIG
jgi:hypothetical protein